MSMNMIMIIDYYINLIPNHFLDSLEHTQGFEYDCVFASNSHCQISGIKTYTWSCLF